MFELWQRVYLVLSVAQTIATSTFWRSFFGYFVVDLLVISTHHIYRQDIPIDCYARRNGLSRVNGWLCRYFCFWQQIQPHRFHRQFGQPWCALF